MEKKKGKIKEVNGKYDIMLEGEDKWLTPVDKVKQYVNESIVGSEVDLVIQNEKITFLKILDGGTKQQNSNVDTSEILKIQQMQNWNMGSIALTLKLGLLNQLETTKHKQGLTTTQQRIHVLLLNKVNKDLKNIKEISSSLEQ